MFTENHDAFLADFGEIATLPAGAVFAGIYDNPDLAGRLGDSLTLGVGAHTFLCKTEDAQGVEIDGIVTLRGKPFCVLENHPDGTGFSLLVLTPSPDEDGMGGNDEPFDRTMPAPPLPLS
jgi:hypothetical protein